MEKIILVILSDIEDHLIRVLKKRLEATFNKVVEIRHIEQNLSYAFDRKRQQFVSPRIISRLRKMKKRNGDMILAVTDVDLYSPGYDFVFGEAEVASGVATISIYRLKEVSDNNRISRNLLGERAVREAIHELAHLYQLGHCSNSGCVMHSCPSVEDVDKAGNQFCDICGPVLSRNLSETFATS